MNIDKANGVYRLKCVIMDRGFIPVLNCRGPILNPRTMDVNEVRLLIKLGIDIRMADDGNRLDLIMVDNMVNEFINGPKKQPVNPPQPVKKEEFKQPVINNPEPVVKEEVKQPVIEKVAEAPVEVQEEVKPKQQPKNNNQNKNKNKK